MSEQVKQEGDFKLQKKRTPMKKLVNANEISKVDLRTPKQPEDAVQIENTDESMLGPKQPELGLQEVEQRNEEHQTVTVQAPAQEEVITVIQEA